MNLQEEGFAPDPKEQAVRKKGRIVLVGWARLGHALWHGVLWHSRG